MTNTCNVVFIAHKKKDDDFLCVWKSTCTTQCVNLRNKTLSGFDFSSDNYAQCATDVGSTVYQQFNGLYIRLSIHRIWHKTVCAITKDNELELFYICGDNNYY